jgi:photosystem II stability/assembly factor-like uncharacterized protein
MRLLFTHTIIFLLFVSGGCGLLDSSESDNEGSDIIPESTLFEGSVVWSDLGLDGIPVHDLEIYDSHLYAATDQGVFKTMINSSVPQWELLGLDSDTTWVSNIEPLSNGDLLAVIHYSNSLDLLDFEPSEIPRLFRSRDSGSSWEPDLSMQLEGIERTQITLLKKQNENNEILFAYRNEILRSDDNGNSWQRFPDFDYSGFFLEENALSLKVNPYNPNQVWYGGSNQQQLTPMVIDSDDGGETWNMRNGPDGSGGVQDVVFSPDDTNVIASVGSTIGITDGTTSPIEGFEEIEGFEWSIVYDSEKHGEILSLDIFTMQNSQDIDSMVYASGRLGEGNGNLAVLLTKDFGENWQYTIYENGPENIRTNNLVVTELNGKETLILATDKGVFGFSID